MNVESLEKEECFKIEIIPSQNMQQFYAISENMTDNCMQQLEWDFGMMSSYSVIGARSLALRKEQNFAFFTMFATYQQ